MPRFEEGLKTRMLITCPACGCNLPLAKKIDRKTGQASTFCVACGAKVGRESALTERTKHDCTGDCGADCKCRVR